MMNYHAWFEHFKEQLQGLTEAFEASGSSLSLLGYALESQRLTVEDYLKWATSFYNLPKLQSRFFTETPISQEMFAKWATHYPWSMECLPVAEWDGSLIVACLQPPQDFPSNPKSVVVLANFQDLKKTWAILKPKRSAQADLTEMPDGIDATLATQTSDNPSQVISADDLDISSENTKSPIQGILSQTPRVTLKPLDKDSQKNTFKSVTSAENSSTADKTVVISANAPAPEPDLVLADELPSEQIVPIMAPTEPEVTVASLHPQMPTPPEADLSVEIPDEEGVVAKTIPLNSRGVNTGKPNTNPVASGQFALDKIKNKNSALISENIQTVLKGMKAHFEKSMIFTVDDNETQLTAFAWDENFQEVKDTSIRFPLKTPSIFNIVASTQKPFHGYISLNEINEKFFEDWNQGHIPDHVTIVPIIVDEKLVGMLMGFAEKSAYNKNSLMLAEKLSIELTKRIEAA